MYGRSFAEVYDHWYPGGDEREVVDFLRARRPAGAAVLELGVGTGRLALPLAQAGLRVTGMDSSPEMLKRLSTKDPSGTVRTLLGDASNPEDWPAGPFDAVLAPCNLLLNLHVEGAQRRCVEAAASVLAPDGLFVVELTRLSVEEHSARNLELRSVEPDVVVLIATEVDPAGGVVKGNHVELRNGEPVRLRPWTIRLLDPAQLDSWCHAAGLALEERVADFSGSLDDGSSACTVSVYRAAGG